MFTNVIQTLNIELLIDTYRLYQRLAPILYWLYSHYIASTAAWLKTTKHSITCPSVIWHWPCSFFPWALSCFCSVVWLRARWVYPLQQQQNEWDWTHLSFNIVHRQSILVSLSIKPWCASKIKPFSWRYRVSLIHMWSVITTSDWSSPHYIHYINIFPRSTFQLELFSMQVIHTKPRVSFGLFVMNWELAFQVRYIFDQTTSSDSETKIWYIIVNDTIIMVVIDRFQMCSAVVTYLIILIQLQNFVNGKNNSGAQTNTTLTN